MDRDKRAADIARLLTDEDRDAVVKALHEHGEATAIRVEGQLLAKRRREAKPEPQGEQLGLYPQPVRNCRLNEDECARRCSAAPGGCDTFGDGLKSDGRVLRIVGRRFEGGAVHLDYEGDEGVARG